MESIEYKNNWNENAVATETIVTSLDVPIQSEDMRFDDSWLSEIGFEKLNIDDENDEELPF